MSKFISAAGEIEMGIMPLTRPSVRSVGGYQPIAYDGHSEMRALIKEMKAIERGGRKVSRRHWIKLARRYVRAKWAMEGRELTMRPPRGGSGVMRPVAPAPMIVRR